jgi:hypothetical protein
MLLIYTHRITKRVKYIFKLIFENLLGIKFVLTSNKEDFRNYNGAKINYSKQIIDDEIFFLSHNLLFEKGIKEQNLLFSESEQSKVFFINNNKKSALAFDPFAASFYLVSRYEEYLPYIKDKYNRFSAKNSIAYKYGFLDKPVVNIWAIKIAEIIKQKFSSFNIPEKNYKFIPTIDIDIAYSYKSKGFVRTIGGYLRALKNIDFHEIAERTKVLTKSKKDPFDTYQFIFDIHKKHNLNPIYFILCADYAQYDKNINTQDNLFRSLIKSIADYAQIGIHPSFASNTNPGKLKIEKNRLSKIINKEITKSRQHFLKLDLPATYRNLIKNDITDDYTMGYASELGFRASICSDFNFYDIDLETETNLKVHPFAVMDGTLKDYMKMSDDNAISYIRPLIKQVKDVNGTFISLWHNESFSNAKTWKGWQKVYEEMVKLSI